MKKTNTKAFEPISAVEAELLKEIVACEKNADWSWHHHISGGFLVSNTGEAVLEFEDCGDSSDACVSFSLMTERNWKYFRGTLKEFKALAEAELVPAGSTAA